MILAVFMRGRVGTIIIVTTLFLLALAAGFWQDHGNKPGRDILAVTVAWERTILEAQKSAFKSTGRAEVSNSVARALINDTARDARTLDPQTASIMEGIGKVTSQLLGPSDEAKRLLVEMNSEQFLKHRGITGPGDLDKRIQTVTAFRASTAELLGRFTNSEQRIRTEMIETRRTGAAPSTSLGCYPPVCSKWS